jgi:transposase-like protein
MSRRPRRNHTPAFKSKVALAPVKGDRTLAQLAEQFDVHPNQIIPTCRAQLTPLTLTRRLAMLAAMRRASSRVRRCAAARRPGSSSK